MKRRKSIAVLACVLVLSLVLSACGSSGNTNKPQPTASQTSTGNKNFSFSMPSATATVNAHVTELSGDIYVIDLTQARLFRWVPAGDGAKASLDLDLAAEKPTASADGLTWTIKISPDAKWANGEPINADTFIYSWKMAMDPKMMNTPGGSSCGENYIKIKNAMAYYTQGSTGKPVDWADVGLKKVDDKTVSVTTDGKYSQNDVMMHFSWRTTGPVYQKFYEGGLNDTKTKTTYGTSAEKFMASGPFKIRILVQGGDVILEKNPNYLRSKDIKLDTITIKVVADEGTKMQLFESGQLDMLDLSSSNIAKYTDDPSVRSYDTQSIRCIEINRTNPDQPILHNNDFMHALYYAMDRTTMAKLCYGVAAPLIISTRSVALDDGTRYRELPVAKANIPENYGYNPTLAKQLFDKALAQENLTKVKLRLNYFTSIPDTKVLSEYLQNTLPKIFGEGKFELEIQGLGSNALPTMQDSISTKPNSYELSWMSWGLTAESFSPAAKFQVYLSTSPRRVANYGNKEIDKLYVQATSEAVRGDKQKVADLSAQMEKIFFDQVLNVPVFQSQKYTMFSEKVKTPVKLSQPGLEWGYAFMDIK